MSLSEVLKAILSVYDGLQLSCLDEFLEVDKICSKSRLHLLLLLVLQIVRPEDLSPRRIT
jgi:hypothetical protein